MKTLITQHHKYLRSLGARWLTALVAVCCSLAVTPAMAQSWTIGTGTSTYSQTSSIPSPLGFYHGAARMQFMWKASELTAAGIPANTTLHQFAFFVASLQNAQNANNSAAPNCEVKIQATPLANLNSSNYVNSGWQATLTGPFEPGLGWNTFNLPSTGILWNGTDNILIDICYYTNFNNGTYQPGNGWAGVRYNTSVPSGGPWAVYNTVTNGQASQCGVGASPTSTTSQRPNIRFSAMTPCVSVAQKGNLNYPATTSGLCPGTRRAIIDTNYGTHINMSFQWLQSTSASGPWAAIQGATEDRLTTPPLTQTLYYRLAQACSFGGRDTTAPVGFIIANPVTWAPLPYFESFESWSNGCGTNDKVSNNWTNIPFTGNASRRRDDQGSSASWSSTSGSLKAKDGMYSSRFNFYQTGPMTTGNEFSLHLDCSGTPGTKELQFWYAFKFNAAGDYDSLTVEYSTDSGSTWRYMSQNGLPPTTSRMNNYFGTPGQWSYATFALPSNSPRTIVRFRSRLKTYGGTDHDIYIDAVRVVNPCTGKPVAGTIDTVLACPGQNATLYTSGTSQAAGLTYLWQSRPAGSTLPWGAMSGGTGPSVTTVMGSAPIDVRVIVGCSNTATPPNADTSAVYRMTPAPFYYCYCAGGGSSSGAQYSYVELGNVTILRESNKDTLMTNGIQFPTVGNPNAAYANYTDYRRTVKITDLVQDSTYRIWLAQTQGYNYFYGTGLGTVWIDYNHNGSFQASEKIMNDKSVLSQTNPTVNQVFTVPMTAKVGITGLRAAISYYYTPVNPCGNTTSNGEFEDYLVRINYQPCTGPASAGTTYQSDTAICPGYTVDLWNTTYQTTRTGIKRAWEVSTDGGASFNYINASDDKDSMINLIVGKATSSKYRLRLICSTTNDTSYSNVVTVMTPAPYRCYPTSWANFGAKDSSDIGTVIIEDADKNSLLLNPSVGAGPHLLNPLAIKRRTDYTLIPPIELHADSTYRLAVFHTMPRAWHADATVSVFMDFNIDGDYDVVVTGMPYTTERVLQGISRADSFFLDTKIKIPSAVIPNAPTGMRVVINNDLNPNAAGNNGSGSFTSGEVEDYVVIFRRTNVGINGVSLLNNIGLYPNPTDGKFNVQNASAQPVRRMDIVVTTVSGQEVIRRSYDNVGTRFNTSLDLSTQAKGIYFVEIHADGEKVTKKLVVQ